MSLQPPNLALSTLQTTEYLDARFNFWDYLDLDELEALVLHAQQAHDDLKLNLDASSANIHTLMSETHISANSHLESAQQLSLIQLTLADDLSELSQELDSAMAVGDKPPTLLEDLEMLHHNLKELETVKGYVQVVYHAVKLGEAALNEVRSPLTVTQPSISRYRALQEFVKKVDDAGASVEDGSGPTTLYLVLFLEKLRRKTWMDIKGVLSSRLMTAAERLGWPAVIEYNTKAVEDRKIFEESFSNLLWLQAIGDKIHPSETNKHNEKVGLYPIQVLILSISLRFKYHFDGTRQTNRLDKPEWYFTHILNVAHDHHRFMDTVIQSLLSSSATEYRSYHAWREFTLLLLPTIARKLKKTIPLLLDSPSLLAHTIYQALTFDAALIEEGFLLQSTSAAPQVEDGAWDGVGAFILGNDEWFQAWLAGEKKFVQDQYRDIITSPDAWLIPGNDEACEDDANVKTTDSARRIRALVEQVTDRYATLPHSVHRARFLTTIQLPLLDEYLARITSSLDAFETLSSAFIRAVPGALSAVNLGGREESSVIVDTRGLTTGVDGVQRLCKALLSATAIVSALGNWGEDLFFLELWQQFNTQDALRESAKTNPLLPACSALDAQAQGEETITPPETLFEEMINRYKKIVVRAEDMIVQQICAEVEAGLKVHFASAPPIFSDADEYIRTTTTMTGTIAAKESNDDNILMPSQTLLLPLSQLTEHISFLRRTLTSPLFAVFYRRIATRLAEHVLQRQILYRGVLGGVRAGRRVRVECELWLEACHDALAGSRVRVEAPWMRLLQAARLLGADGEAWRSVVESTYGSASDEKWENIVGNLTGLVAMSRDEVKIVLKRRTDCFL